MPLANVGSRTARVGEDRREEVLEAIRAETGEDLGNTLGCTLLIDTTRWNLKHCHERVDEVREIVFAESLDKPSEGFRGRRSCLGHGIDEDLAHEGDELRQVGDEILRFGESSKVADDGGRFSFDVGGSLAKTTVENGNQLFRASSLVSGSGLVRLSSETTEHTKARDEASMK